MFIPNNFTVVQSNDIGSTFKTVSKLLIVVYITGCSAGEQYSHRLFSRVLLGAQVGGMRGRQQSGLGRGTDQE